MKIFSIIIVALAISQSVLADVKFGLLVCEQGPVIYRQSTVPGVTFGINPPSKSQCKAGKVVCNKDFGFFDDHGGLGMCSVTRQCGGGEQVCLRKFVNGVGTIQGCCKPSFEAWALSGSQKTSGNQNPPPNSGARMAVEEIDSEMEDEN